MVEEDNCPSPEKAVKDNHWQISAYLKMILDFCLHSVKGRDVGGEKLDFTYTRKVVGSEK